jgi:hypothetical protein
MTAGMDDLKKLRNVTLLDDAARDCIDYTLTEVEGDSSDEDVEFYREMGMNAFKAGACWMSSMTTFDPGCSWNSLPWACGNGTTSAFFDHEEEIEDQAEALEAIREEMRQWMADMGGSKH